MGHGYIVRRGGGAGLNFKIVGNPQPASADENTIWVNTDIPITGYAFSVDEPASPVDGFVWISTGMLSAVEFNALKTNDIMVYPVSARQYIDGAWANKLAKTYLNGEWVDWTMYLYNKGNEYTEMTGGWVADNYRLYGNTAAKTPTVTKRADGIAMSNTNGDGSVRTKNKISLDAFNKLVVRIESSQFGSVGIGAITRSATCIGLDAACRYRGDLNSSMFPTNFEVDISSLTGEYYIAIGASGYDDTTKTVLISKIWFE